MRTHDKGIHACLKVKQPDRFVEVSQHDFLGLQLFDVFDPAVQTVLFLHLHPLQVDDLDNSLLVA